MKMRKVVALLLAALILAMLCSGCQETQTGQPQKLCDTTGDRWCVGFGSAQILPDEESEQPLYIAGYDPDREITGVRDYCQARAVWIDTGAQGVLLIGVDCVGLDSGSVARIRQSLSDIPDCAAINVYSTHTHAGIDTMGLWGPTAIDGKNEAYMKSLFRAAEEAARAAAADRHAATLHFGKVRTPDMFRDSRLPLVYDDQLYQLRFETEDGSAGTRLFFYGAHAESLRGANTLLSRDFPGLLCDTVTEKTGDNTMFFPGAIGGLVMTKDFVNGISSPADAEQNLQITAEKLVDFAMSIRPEDERIIAPQMKLVRAEFTVALDNPIFATYKFLGIFQNNAVKADSATGYGVKTELSILQLGNLGIALLPGEIFPELVLGGEYGKANLWGKNPEPLLALAQEQGLDALLVVGLANDEIGYIVPPSDFLVNPKLPYLERFVDYKEEDHYEETNSVGPGCAQALADAFAAAAAQLGN